ncbi:MAG TPA: NUDIX domain-containing protein [Acidimicrobiia bacterium]|jgi:ADP-ribose pyrophosphatase YjhB (NUDIX family)|nr:NUDIX domain-containing protein [Acidimicrobiia bacterium]HIL07022.1 NUDIX domain-containing protein [Acidimicrobiia bacterium]
MPEPCVGAVLLWDGALLLVKRGQEPGIGQWSLPGGRLEPQEAWQDGVEREVQEETGLKVNCGEFVGWVERSVAGHRYLIADFFVTTEDPSGATPGDDAGDLTFVDPEQIKSLELTAGLEEFLFQHSVLTP